MALRSATRSALRTGDICRTDTGGPGALRRLRCRAARCVRRYTSSAAARTAAAASGTTTATAVTLTPDAAAAESPASAPAVSLRGNGGAVASSVGEMRAAGRADRDEDGDAALDADLAGALAEAVIGDEALAVAALVRVRVPDGDAESVAVGEGEEKETLKNVTLVTLRKGWSTSNTETAYSKWRVQRLPVRTAGPKGRPSGLHTSGYHTEGAAQLSELPQ